MAHSDILSQPDRGLGLDRPQTEALLALFSRCDDLREFGREVIQSVVNALMDSQAQEACGAPRGSRSPERVNSRNGYRERSLSTSLGDLELRVPKLREGTYFPEGILKRYTRVEASMVALVREMYVAGVSTARSGSSPRSSASRRCPAPRCRRCAPGWTRRPRRSGPGRSRASTPTCGSTRPT